MAGARRKVKGPTKREIEKLRKELNAITKAFFAQYGDFDFMLVGPPGPRPPPKKDIRILNLSSY